MAGVVSCKKCGIFFKSEGHKNRHMLKHQDTRHECSFCFKVFVRHDSYIRHFRKQHQSEAGGEFIDSIKIYMPPKKTPGLDTRVKALYLPPQQDIMYSPVSNWQLPMKTSSLPKIPLIQLPPPTATVTSEEQCTNNGWSLVQTTPTIVVANTPTQDEQSIDSQPQGQTDNGIPILELPTINQTTTAELGLTATTPNDPPATEVITFEMSGYDEIPLINHATTELEVMAITSNPPSTTDMTQEDLEALSGLLILPRIDSGTQTDINMYDMDQLMGKSNLDSRVVHRFTTQATANNGTVHDININLSLK
jgi:uncharacterized C2H2 Zn-finger protein